MSTATSQPTQLLTAADRCDRCGAQAKVVSQHGDLFLYWCWHHAREHWNKIKSTVIIMEGE